MLVGYIVTREYVKVRHPGLAEKIVQWIEDRLDGSLELDAAAAALGKSRSTVSHTVKTQLGMSFKQLCIIKKIQRFESLVAEDPALTVGEAASRVGYDDPFYFSRLYKKVRLASPSTYIKSVRAAV